MIITFKKNRFFFNLQVLTIKILFHSTVAGQKQGNELRNADQVRRGKNLKEGLQWKGKTKVAKLSWREIDTLDVLGKGLIIKIIHLFNL